MQYVVGNEGLVSYIMNENKEEKLEKMLNRVEEYLAIMDLQLDNFTNVSDTVKILINSEPEQLKEMARILAEGRDAMAETKGELKQMDKRVDDNRTSIKFVYVLLTTLSLTLIGLVAKIAWDINRMSIAP